jgi:3D (Asp-Asp-Asp) domain-containing protein
MVLARSTARRLGTAAVLALALVVLHGLRSRVGEVTFDGQAPATQELAPGATLVFEASAYCKGQVTASGAAPRSGIAAADPRVLPVGSVVHVQTETGSHDGVYTILDTGPTVTGRIVDLYMWSCHEALDFGRQDVRITIVRLGWDPAESSPPTAPVVPF